MAKKENISSKNLHDAPNYKTGTQSPSYQRGAAARDEKNFGYQNDFDIMAEDEKTGGIIHDEPTPTPKHAFIQPKERDYNKGYIKRYFIVKYDGTSTTEVSKKWMADNGKKLPKIYDRFTIQWFITNYSNEPIELGMMSPTANDRNKFTVGKIKNEFLKQLLMRNYLQYFMG